MIHRSGRSSEKLSLFDAVAMAMGGMIGGGIFAVLGEAVRRAGNATFLAFGLAGLLALVTGSAYSRLTLRFDEPGGSFTYVERLAGPELAGTLSWFLLLGYTFTLSLYAHTFGAYATDLVGLPVSDARWLGAGVIGVFAALNLAGVRESGVTEDILVYTKVAILVLLGIVGLFAVRPTEAFPVFDRAPGGVVGTAALIFVAYEGFQLLTYDYDDIAEPRRNLPRALHISIPAVIAIYMLVAFVTTGTLTDAAVARHSETVLAYAARPLFGRAGITIVLVGAVFSTASAINATIFASARLARRMLRDGQLPGFFGRWHSGGVSVPFVLLTACMSMAIDSLAGLGEITAFSSLVFLLVFAIVNASAIPHAVFGRRQRAFPVAGVLGCLGAAAVITLDLARSEPMGLAAVGLIAGALLAGRLAFLFWRHPRAG